MYGSETRNVLKAVGSTQAASDPFLAPAHLFKRSGILSANSAAGIALP